MDQVYIEDEVETAVTVRKRFLRIANDKLKARGLSFRILYHVLTNVEAVTAGVEKLGKYRKVICRSASRF